jgi:hypothetical protein
MNHGPCMFFSNPTDGNATQSERGSEGEPSLFHTHALHQTSPVQWRAPGKHMSVCNWKQRKVGRKEEKKERKMLGGGAAVQWWGSHSQNTLR